MIFGFLSQNLKTQAVAVAFSIAWPGSEVEPGAEGDVQARDRLTVFRSELYRCLTARADELFELADAVLCAAGPVRDLAGLSLVPEHRRGHGALYDAVNHGQIGIGRLRRSLAGLPLPRAADGRLVLAADVSNWLRPGAVTSPERLFCHVYGRGKGQAQMIPGWPYSVVAALEPGRTSWTAVLDAVRLGPDDDETAVTAAQVRDVVTRLIEAGHWREGNPVILVVFDAGYDVARLSFLLADLPVELLGRLRSDRVMQLPAAPRQPGTMGRPRSTADEIALADPATWPAPAGQHEHADLPVRNSGDRRLGPGAPPAHPPRRLAGPRRSAARHRGHPDPAAGGSPARGPRPQARVAVVLPHRRRPGQRGPVWQAFLRRFDLEHTFRLFKQVLGWTVPKIRNPEAADRWTWIIITAHTQLRLARPLAADLRLPWERPASPGRLTPARVRRGFRNIRATACPPQPAHRNPASPDPAGHQGRRTGGPHPATTSGKPPKGNAPSRPCENAQVKRQAQAERIIFLRLSRAVLDPGTGRYQARSVH